MSLISDALKKAQQQREKLQGDQETPPPIKGSKLYSNKRLLVYGSLGIIIILAVVIVTIVFSPKEQSQMRAMNIRDRQPPAAVDIKTPEQPKVAAEEKAAVKEEMPVKAQPLESKPAEPPQPPPEKPPEKPRQKPPAVIHKKIEKIKEPPPKRKITEKFSAAELSQQGDEFLAEKKYLWAVEKYKDALKLEKDANLYLKLYTAFKAMDNPVLARAYIDDGLKHFPEDFYLNKISTILYIRSKEFHKALGSVKKALEKNPDDYTLYTYQGLCYFHGKDYPAAMVHFQKSLELNSDAVENYYYIGLIFDNRKQYQKALEYYNVFFKLNPDNKNFKHREWILQRMRTLQQYLNQ